MTRKIRLHAVVCDNSIDYFRYMVTNHREMASADADIRVVAHCTDEAALRAVSQSGLAQTTIPVYRHPSFFVVGSINYVPNLFKLLLGKPVHLGASSGHAAGLNSAFRLTGGDAFDVIADCDTVVVMSDWDRVVADILSRYGALGASYEDIGGISSGSGPVQTYKGLPNLSWVALSQRHDFRSFDASHRLLRGKRIRTQTEAEVFHLPVGHTLLCDVGWKLPRFLAKKSIPAKAMVNVKPAFAQARVLAGLNDYHEEFHLDGEPFLAHQRGSHKHRFREAALSGPFYAAVERYLQTQRNIVRAGAGA